MNAPADTPPAVPRPRASRRRLWIVVALAGVLLGAGAYGWWSWSPAPEPPAIALDHVDPAVAAVIREARDEVRASPRSAAAWGRLGMVLAAHDFPADARTCFARAEQFDGRDPRWPYHQAVLLEMDRGEGALPRLRRAVELCGDEPSAPRLRLAEWLLSRDQAARAEELFRQVIKADPANPRALLGLARVAYQRKDYRGSLALLESCGASPFGRKATHTLASEVFHRLNEPGAADREARLAAALPRDPRWPDPFLDEVIQLRVGEAAQVQLANEWLRQQRYPDAAALLRQVVQSYPGSARARILLGQALLRQGDFAGAREALAGALRVNAASAEALVYLGICRANLGDRPGAVRSFRRAIRLEPGYAFAYYNLGSCLKEQGDRAGAVRAWRDALRCRVNYVDAHVALGELLVDLEQDEEGLRHLEQAARLSHGDEKVQAALQAARERSARRHSQPK